jgi:hypothetical protein
VSWLSYIWAGIVIVVGVRWIVRRKVDVGLEDRAPAWTLIGNRAVVLGVVAILIGVLVFVGTMLG